MFSNIFFKHMFKHMFIGTHSSMNVPASPTEDSSRWSFDMSVNHDADLHDLRQTRIWDYLCRIGDPLSDTAMMMPLESLCKETGIVSGTSDVEPLNVGVLFFTDRPDQFLPGAFIDVVYKPVPSGDGMEEYHVTGPLDVQIANAMSIASRFIGEKVWKPESGLEAKRVGSYPAEAVRELLVNAVCHKSYQIPEPVRVTITPSSIEILTYPGPDASISDEEIRSNRLSEGACRNVRVHGFLKNLGLAHRCGTGIPKAVESLKDNGSPPLRIITDSGRTYFKAVLGIHPDFIRRGLAAEDIPIEDRIVALLEAHGRMRMLDISTGLGFKGINSTVRSAVGKLMSEGKAGYLYPEAPRSPKQRICLTSDKKP